ncbi:MAG TPA: helix-turn-helix transcriptional regulator [Candidatus Galloscillospira excrementipullorum]|nr:helix-turn-helix transcriptional regulator [Candidatus Galloscillospira excrementipullorum]
MNSVETGARIAALRKERGMTQRDLAQPVGVSDKAVSKWERGECFPDVTLFPRLAALFEVDLEELMG